MVLRDGRCLFAAREGCGGVAGVGVLLMLVLRKRVEVEYMWGDGLCRCDDLSRRGCKHPRRPINNRNG